MVAITVAIAATVYIWAGGFGGSGDGPESGSATAKVVDLDSTSGKEWIKITLTSGGDNAPYDNASVGSQVAWSTGSSDGLCDNPQTGTGAACSDYFGDPASETWEVGSAKWFPCHSTTRHSISISIQETAVLDRTVQCGQDAS